ncbi:HAMP domain-containing protein [Glaciihabitans tibetensis]|uniref:histidine kinase n=1 Tax=Glaciihabitans tibetensis TaxID=1266600 RepID=A0A2T0VAT2_9MICO|nr:HAMP domain-containing sensor histidine kinase [Glaciihabitans tibetensis]PRY67178.1 HAMP domain-containing protein [Glaciihabitans tibetensis]
MHEHLTQWWNAVSLRTKITGVTVMLLTLGLAVAGLGTMSVLRTYLVGELDDKISDSAVTLINSVDDLNGDCAIDKFYGDYYLSVLDSDAVTMCSTSVNPRTSPVTSGLTIERVASEDSAFTLSNADRTSQWRVIAQPYANSLGEQVTVLVGLSLDSTNKVIANYAATFLFFALTVVVLGGALTRLLVTSTFHPLHEVEETAARFAAGDFSQRLGGATPNTEVGRLNQSLNTMLSRIDSAFGDRARTIDQMRRFVGDASHELRTPLVSVRGYAELYRMGALTTPDEVAQAMERIEKEAIRMGALVQDLLELARIDEAKPLKLAPVDLIPLASDAAMDAMASSPGRAVRVVVTEPIRHPTAAELGATTSTAGTSGAGMPGAGMAAGTPGVTPAEPLTSTVTVGSQRGLAFRRPSREVSTQGGLTRTNSGTNEPSRNGTPESSYTSGYTTAGDAEASDLSLPTVIDGDDGSQKPGERSAAQTTGPISFAGNALARLRSRRLRPAVKGAPPEVVVDTIPVAASATVLAEENKIRQVITNLMGNALRFAPAGSPIEIMVTVDEVQDTAVISVVDHGEGIPPQIRDKIFQRFWRADSSRNRDTGGSGLGLAIVASIVASHGGSVDVVETPGGGATFRVSLPLLHEDPAATDNPTAA